MSDDNFARPHIISDVQRAFPADVVRNLMPAHKDIPADYPDKQNWHDFFTDLFFRGSGTAFENWNLYTRDDISADVAWKHLTTILGSYEPKHEHKEAAFTWLASRWFVGIENIKESN